MGARQGAALWCEPTTLSAPPYLQKSERKLRKANADAAALDFAALGPRRTRGGATVSYNVDTYFNSRGLQ